MRQSSVQRPAFYVLTMVTSSSSNSFSISGRDAAIADRASAESAAAMLDSELTTARHAAAKADKAVHVVSCAILRCAGAADRSRVGDDVLATCAGSAVPRGLMLDLEPPRNRIGTEFAGMARRFRAEVHDADKKAETALAKVIAPCRSGCGSRRRCDTNKSWLPSDRGA